MTHSMNDVSFRKRVSNVEEKQGQNKFNKKKASPGRRRGTLSKLCRFSSSTCWLWGKESPPFRTGDCFWLIPKLAFFCVLQTTTLAIEYLHSVLLTDFKIIASTGRRQSKEDPDTGREACGGWGGRRWSPSPTEPHSISLAFRHYLEPAGSIGWPQIDRLRRRQTFPLQWGGTSQDLVVCFTYLYRGVGDIEWISVLFRFINRQKRLQLQ